MALRDSKTNQSKNKCAENMKSTINPEWLKQLDKAKPSGRLPSTPDEIEFVRLGVIKGLTTKCIADIMGVSINKVKYLRSTI